MDVAGIPSEVHSPTLKQQRLRLIYPCQGTDTDQKKMMLWSRLAKITAVKKKNELCRICTEEVTMTMV